MVPGREPPGKPGANRRVKRVQHPATVTPAADTTAGDAGRAGEQGEAPLSARSLTWFYFFHSTCSFARLEGGRHAADPVARKDGRARPDRCLPWPGSGVRTGPELGRGRDPGRPGAPGAGRHSPWLRPGRPAEPGTFAAGLPGTAAERQRAHLPWRPWVQVAAVELRQRPSQRASLPAGIGLHARADSVAGHAHRHAHLCPVPLPREQAIPRPAPADSDQRQAADPGPARQRRLLHHRRLHQELAAAHRVQGTTARLLRGAVHRALCLLPPGQSPGTRPLRRLLRRRPRLQRRVHQVAVGARRDRSRRGHLRPGRHDGSGLRLDHRDHRTRRHHAGEHGPGAGPDAALRRLDRAQRPAADQHPARPARRQARLLRRLDGHGRLDPPPPQARARPGRLMAAVLPALLDALAAETAALDAVLAPLRPPEWARPTPAAGWNIADQVSHLAYFDETALLAAVDPARFRHHAREVLAGLADLPDRVAAEHRDRAGRDLLDWFRGARQALLDGFASVDPSRRLPWYGPDMSPASSVTARLMETWAHGQDVCDALGTARPVTNRLRHIAHLGVRTMAFSFALNGLAVPDDPVRVELSGPGSDRWAWGPPEAANRIRGTALDFCLAVTQRRNPADLALDVRGGAAQEWITIAQAFAGPPGLGRPPSNAGTAPVTGPRGAGSRY